MIGLCIYVYRPTHISTTTAVNFVIVNCTRCNTHKEVNSKTLPLTLTCLYWAEKEVLAVVVQSLCTRVFTGLQHCIYHQL